MAFALGVVEPDASSIGGDGQAILFLKGMTEPVVIEYKDMTPGHATPDNPKLFTPTGARTAPDGPTVANIPGVVAGLDLLYQKYGSKKVAWADLDRAGDQARRRRLHPRRGAADVDRRGTRRRSRSIRRPRRSSCRAARCRSPAIASSTRTTPRRCARSRRKAAQSFYRGSIARRIADDMAANGGVITLEDLGAVPRDGAQAARRAAIAATWSIRCRRRCRPALQIVETLQHPRQLHAARRARRYTTDADYLHYAIEAWRVRDGGAPHRRSRALAGRSRQSPRAGARARAVQADRSEEGVRRRRVAAGRPAVAAGLRRVRHVSRLRIRRRDPAASRPARRRSSSPTPKAT